MHIHADLLQHRTDLFVIHVQSEDVNTMAKAYDLLVEKCSKWRFERQTVSVMGSDGKFRAINVFVEIANSDAAGAEPIPRIGDPARTPGKGVQIPPAPSGGPPQQNPPKPNGSKSPGC